MRRARERWRQSLTAISAEPAAARHAERYVESWRLCYEWEGFHECPEHDAQVADYWRTQSTGLFAEYLLLLSAHRWLCAAEGYEFEEDKTAAQTSRRTYRARLEEAGKARSALIRAAAKSAQGARGLPRPVKVARVGLLCGIVSPVFWVGLIAIGDVYRADINPVVDFISELGERGGSTEWLLRAGGFVGTGVLLMVFGAALPVATSPRWKAVVVGALVVLDGIGRAGAGVYPCDPGCESLSRGQELHRLFATIGFCSGILAALAAGLLYRRRLDGLIGLATMVFLLLMTWEENPIHAEGLWERLATGALSVWLFTFALWVTRTGHGVSLGSDSAKPAQFAP